MRPTLLGRIPSSAQTGSVIPYVIYGRRNSNFAGTAFTTTLLTPVCDLNLRWTKKNKSADMNVSCMVYPSTVIQHASYEPIRQVGGYGLPTATFIKAIWHFFGIHCQVYQVLRSQ